MSANTAPEGTAIAEATLTRRHLRDDEADKLLSAEEIARLPAVAGWMVAVPWQRRGAPERGVPHDFVLTLSHPTYGLAETFVTSYDLDGRSPEILARWIRGKVAESIADARRRYRGKSPT